METAKLKKFAQFARRSLMEQVSTKLKRVLAKDSAARRENPQAVAEIEKQIFGVADKYTDNCTLSTDDSQRQAQLVERVAYIWFNRFCALCFMDVNRYTHIGVVSPAEGQFQPEILAEAKMGHIDEGMVSDQTRQQIFDLLEGRVPSRDQQGEAYRLLVVGACNYWHRAMPFLFERIDDYTELLMPDDLLSGNSILAYTREAMTPDACQDVEVIGWLYQFYISEKKDDVFDGLKKNKKITPENIPAATQLFTPHWIVKYLVENSLGRLWMLNRPNSKLVDRMDYYIRPDTSVGSEKWEVESKEKHDDSEKLSGTDRLAEGDGSGGIGISGNETVSKGGALRADQSGKTSSGVDSIQYCGGSSEIINGRVQELSVDSARLQGRSGNTNHDSPAAASHITTSDRTNSGTVGGNQTDDLLTNSKAAITSHSPLPTSHLRISSPEEIRICDPACGSGHMLTYAFDLLYAIYEEEGYEPAEIPSLILTHNLYGIEIDERAGELAAFALTMKARAKQRRFFRKQIQPNICVLQKIENVTTNEHEWTQIVDEICKAGIDRHALIHDLTLFDETDNFGSLLKPELTAVQAQKALAVLTEYDQSITAPTFMHRETVDKCQQALIQADYLSQKYQIVIANPPYMGSKGMNGRLGKWLKDNYSDVKSDLFSAFIVRNTELTLPKGQLGFMTPFVWMFISSYEKLRQFLINQKTITSLVQLEYSGFEGATVPICTFTIENFYNPNYQGGYIRLSDFKGAVQQGPKCLEIIQAARKAGK